jgi:hypothetical protein
VNEAVHAGSMFSTAGASRSSDDPLTFSNLDMFATSNRIAGQRRMPEFRSWMTASSSVPAVLLAER